VRTEFISTTDILGAVKDLRTPEFQQGMAQIAPFQEYEHEASPPAEDEGDDADNSSEEEGNDMAEVKRIVEENWPGGGEMIVQSEHNNPHSPLGKLSKLRLVIFLPHMEQSRPDTLGGTWSLPQVCFPLLQHGRRKGLLKNFQPSRMRRKGASWYELAA
jgi:hypothetical protein